MTWQQNEPSPARLDPRDTEGAPPAGSGSGQFIEGSEHESSVEDSAHAVPTEEGPGAAPAAATEVHGAGRTDPGVQNEPVEDGALDKDRQGMIDGIVAQTRQDLEQGHSRSAHELLKQRFEQSGIPVSDDELGRLSDELRSSEKH
jgi:hypothetical protein